MTNVEQLDEKLKAMDAKIGGVTLGPFYGNAEVIAGEILLCLERLAAGDFELIETIGE